MNFDNIQLNELINKLEKSKSYLTEKSEPPLNYSNLIDKVDLKIKFLQEHSKPVIKLVSTAKNSVLNLKVKSEDNLKLRSLYHFEAVSPFKNLSEIVNNSQVIFIIFRSDRTITKHQHKLIDLARKKQVDLFILIERFKTSNSPASLRQYIELQNYTDIKKILWLENEFFDCNNPQQIETYQQFLIERAERSRKTFILHHYSETIDLIENYFTRQKNSNWRKIKQIKAERLKGREVNNYQQQIITKTFNKIAQQQQQQILSIKQKINQSRSYYTNPFIFDSWTFELQEIIERSQVKLVKEKTETYLYLVVEKGDRSEYIHSYILNLLQEKVTQTLKLQWSEINYTYAEGLNALVTEIEQKIASIDLLDLSETKNSKITFNSEFFPELDLSKIVDLSCFRANSRLIFDYSYTQSSWFKLLMFGLVGIAIYLFTKIYFGKGIYIGFVILVFQLINISTGQSIKKIKLKSHKRELQRTVNSKYQILIRLIVERMIQTLISSLEAENNRYRTQIDAIANLAERELETIKQKIERHQAISKKLESDRHKILSWLN